MTNTGKVEFPDDLNQHFNNGSINLKEDRDQLVPTMANLSDVIQNCGNGNDMLGFFDNNTKQEQREI